TFESLFSTLLNFTVEHQRVGHNLVSRAQTAQDLLRLIGVDRARFYFGSTEPLVVQLDKNPVAVLQAQHRTGGNHGARFGPLRYEMNRGKHVRPQDPRLVGQLDAHFRGTRVGIEQFGDVGDTTRQAPIGVGIQLNFGPVAKMNARQVILVYIAKNPDIGEVRDREQVRRVVQRFDSGRGS